MSKFLERIPLEYLLIKHDSWVNSDGVQSFPRDFSGLSFFGIDLSGHTLVGALGLDTASFGGALVDGSPVTNKEIRKLIGNPEKDSRAIPLESLEVESILEGDMTDEEFQNNLEELLRDLHLDSYTYDGDGGIVGYCLQDILKLIEEKYS